MPQCGISTELGFFPVKFQFQSPSPPEQKHFYCIYRGPQFWTSQLQCLLNRSFELSYEKGHLYEKGNGNFYFFLSERPPGGLRGGTMLWPPPPRAPTSWVSDAFGISGTFEAQTYLLLLQLPTGLLTSLAPQARTTKSSFSEGSKRGVKSEAEQCSWASPE